MLQVAARPLLGKLTGDGAEVHRLGDDLDQQGSGHKPGSREIGEICTQLIFALNQRLTREKTTFYATLQRAAAGSDEQTERAARPRETQQEREIFGVMRFAIGYAHPDRRLRYDADVRRDFAADAGTHVNAENWSSSSRSSRGNACKTAVE